MKNVIFAAIFSLAAASANAANVSATVSASSDLLYRGQSVTDGQPTVAGTLDFTDVFVDGVFVKVGTAVIDASPVDANKTLRTDVGVGYAGQVGRLDYAVSVNRVFNPVVERTVDFNEVRGELTFNATEKLDLLAQVAVATDKQLGRDAYAAVGIGYNGLFTDKLDVTVLTSGRYFDLAGTAEYNNFQVGASYAVTDNLSVFGDYSVGGETVLDFVEQVGTFNAASIPSVGQVGLRYNFN